MEVVALSLNSLGLAAGCQLPAALPPKFDKQWPGVSSSRGRRCLSDSRHQLWTVLRGPPLCAEIRESQLSSLHATRLHTVGETNLSL